MKIKKIKIFDILSICLLLIILIIWIYNSINLTPEQYIKDSLEEDGYKVFYVGLTNITNYHGAYVDMEPFGNSYGERYLQVTRGLSILHEYYENASFYSVYLINSAENVFYPPKECICIIPWEIYRAYLESDISAINYVSSKIDDVAKNCF